MAQNQLQHTWIPAPPPDEPPRDYFVPHFGTDEDVKGALGAADLAERQLDHKWDVLAPAAKDPPRNYFVPHFGMDEDVKTSIDNMHNAEGVYGKMSKPAINW